jgi:hypothetical protein
MMGFSVGYRVLSGEPDYFCDIVRDYGPSIREVYFAWPGEPSGRAPVDPEALEQLRWELGEIRGIGVRLNLLLNASCYGEHTLSAAFEDHVVALVGELVGNVGLDAVTTMSPVVAGAIRKRYPSIDVRASVNMRLGTVRAMRYVARYYDSYCMQREYNRDPERIAELREWASANGKTLHVLANSGCLNCCSFQTFHDNAVSHEGAARRQPAQGRTIPTLCREHYTDRTHWASFLQGSWIRPEDLAAHHAMAGCEYKLATRQHDNPRAVIGAYAGGRYYGNLLDLMEPGHGPAFHPFAIDNRAFPVDWFERTTRCGQACETCGYCAEVLGRVLLDGGGIAEAVRPRTAPDRESTRR